MPNNSHLTLDERVTISSCIQGGQTITAIALLIGKDKSTISKEIKKRRRQTYTCPLPLECANYQKCRFHRKCTKNCPAYAPFKCKRRDRSPGACNGCPNICHCRFTKFKYEPQRADDEYRSTLSTSRKGINMTPTEAEALAVVVAPLIKQGLSPFAILQMHPELNLCERSMYNYIESGLFHHISGLTNLDLRRKVARKIPQKVSLSYKKRKDNSYLKGRTYDCYLEYARDNPNVLITQMDTVYNNVSNGPFLQTFKFVEPGILFAILHEEKTAKAMLEGVNLLENILGRDVFRKYVGVLLTDRGSEFTAAEAMERSSDGNIRTRVFYCDPMQAGQKGSLENKHIELRYILPKGKDLAALGLTDQGKLNLVLSNINSYPLEKLGGKSPLEKSLFLYPDLAEKLIAYGIEVIAKDKIILRPTLLKSR